MKEKQNVLWVLLCVLALVGALIAMLACMPAWDGSPEPSALQAIFALVRSWFA